MNLRNILWGSAFLGSLFVAGVCSDSVGDRDEVSGSFQTRAPIAYTPSGNVPEVVSRYVGYVVGSIISTERKEIED